ncbi:MAG: radical SAM protein [Candidatus Polarisedimenticolia bacterium]
MKIVLAYKCHDLGRMEFYSRFTPLGLGTISSLLRREGFDAPIVNASAWSWPRVDRFLKTERPDVLGVSTFTFNRHEAMRLAALARRANPRCLIVAGGPHATHLPHHLLRRYPQLDLVARGEGEATMLELVRAATRGALPAALPSIAGITYRAGGLPCFGHLPEDDTDGAAILDTTDRPVITDLDSLPHPCADPHLIGVDTASQFEFIITSRGCPAACTFCSSPDFWGRALRFRSAPHMLEEIRLLRERHGVVYVSVRDDTFTVNKKRVIDFCRGLLDTGIDLLWDCQSRVNAVDEERLAWMRRAGCTHIQYGVESGSPRMLRRLNKGITTEQIRTAAETTRRVGLGLSIYLITGIDGETDADLDSTLRLIETIRPHDGLVSPLTVYPGTGQYEDAKRRLGLTEDFWVRARDEAFFVRRDPWTRRALRTLGAALRRAGRQAAYDLEDFERQRALVGDCHAHRLGVAEYWERRGLPGRARAEYEALLRDNPRSLWARMRLGRLAMRRRRFAEAAGHYRAAAAVVPAFELARRLEREARAALGRRRSDRRHPAQSPVTRFASFPIP